jgi:hypothetical protein
MIRWQLTAMAVGFVAVTVLTACSLGPNDGDAVPSLTPSPPPAASGLPADARLIAQRSRGEEVLAIDGDGAALISYHLHAKEVVGTGTREGWTIWAGEEPGVALVSPTGERTSLLAPKKVSSNLESAAWADLNGDKIAVRIASVTLDSATEGVPTGSFYFGSRSGELKPLPAVTVDGEAPYLGLGPIHAVASGIVVSGQYAGVYEIDPATGKGALVGPDEVSVPTTYRDLCADDGEDIIGYSGYVGLDTAAPRGQWTARWGGGGTVATTRLAPASGDASDIFAVSCGDSVADVLGATRPTTVVWRAGGEDHQTELPTDNPAAQLFMPDGFLLVQTHPYKGGSGGVYAVRQADGVATTGVHSCWNMLARGNLVAIGTGDINECAFYVTPVDDLFGNN